MAAKEKDKPPPDEEELRDAEALRTTDDDELLGVLAKKKGARVENSPEADIEAELQKRGYHYDAERGTWVK
jgi:hypothetical protein